MLSCSYSWTSLFDRDPTSVTAIVPKKRKSIFSLVLYVPENHAVGAFFSCCSIPKCLVPLWMSMLSTEPTSVATIVRYKEWNWMFSSYFLFLETIRLTEKHECDVVLFLCENNTFGAFFSCCSLPKCLVPLWMSMLGIEPTFVAPIVRYKKRKLNVLLIFYVFENHTFECNASTETYPSMKNTRNAVPIADEKYQPCKVQQ